MIHLGLLHYKTQTNLSGKGTYSYCHNQLLPPMSLRLFSTSSQVLGYDIKTTSVYFPRYCRTTLKQFKMPNQGLMIWHFLPQLHWHIKLSYFSEKDGRFLMDRSESVKPQFLFPFRWPPLLAWWFLEDLLTLPNFNYYWYLLCVWKINQ